MPTKECIQLIDYLITTNELRQKRSHIFHVTYAPHHYPVLQYSTFLIPSSTSNLPFIHYNYRTNHIPSEKSPIFLCKTNCCPVIRSLRDTYGFPTKNLPSAWPKSIFCETLAGMISN